MKKLLLVIITVTFVGACGGRQSVSKRPIENSENSNELQKETVAAHSVDKEREKSNLPGSKTVEKSGERSGWTRSGDPIDTSKYDEAIASAEKAVAAKTNDSSAKNTAADAFYQRGFALTEARQYAAAIGDFRAALKYQPDHEESKKWIEVITGIYNSMNREIPKAGEEPKALEFGKGKS